MHLATYVIASLNSSVGSQNITVEFSHIFEVFLANRNIQKSLKKQIVTSFLTVFSAAVRFGRIPKREKQRLLDEMQSYMNSLNESAAMDMNSSFVKEPPTSQADSSSKEAIGAISRAYQDIFSGSREQRTAKRAKITTTNDTSQDCNFQPTSGQANSGHTCWPCLVAPDDHQLTFHAMDNNHYAYVVSASQHHQPSLDTPQRGAANSSCKSGHATNQPSCPWKLAPGAKVLVSLQG